MKLLIGFKNGNGLESEVEEDLDGSSLYHLFNSATHGGFVIFPNSIVNRDEIAFIHIIKEALKEKAEVVPFDKVPGEIPDLF